jgi:DNA-binding LytR/AlgR family response regulator
MGSRPAPPSPETHCRRECCRKCAPLLVRPFRSSPPDSGVSSQSPRRQPLGGKKGKGDLVSQVQKLVENEKKPPTTPLRILRAGAGDTVRMIPIEEVCYFQASDKYTAVVTREGESLIRVPLRELLPQLPPERFAQVHRGTIVNLDEVTAAVRDDSGRISLKLRNRKETLPVSRIYADQFRQM